MYTNQNYFDSYECPPPLNIPKQINNGIYSEYQIHKNDSYCAAYCLYVLYLPQIKSFKMQYEIYTIKLSNLINEES